MITKDELKKILDYHAKWLSGYAEGKIADLCGKDLSCADLSGSNFSGADFKGANVNTAFFPLIKDGSVRDNG